MSAESKETELDLQLPARLRKPRLRRDEASEYLLARHGLPIAKATLAKLVSVGGGPLFNKTGSVILYPRDELDRWAIKKLGPLRSSSSSKEAA